MYPGPNAISMHNNTPAERAKTLLFFSKNKAITKIIIKDVPAAPTTGNAPQRNSLIAPRFIHGNPDITQDLNHSNKKNIDGRTANLYLLFLKYLTAIANKPKYIEI